MAKERTEEQVLSKAPLKVKLGNVDYELPILAITRMGEWRKKVIATAKEIGELGVSLLGLGQAFLAFPEKIVELVFAYAPNLPKDKIMDAENGATEEQFALAFSQIESVAFPYQRQVSLMKSLATIQSLSPSEKSTNSSSPSTDSRQIM
jgi:hypothetical protein